MIWKTRDGEEIPIEQMEDGHVANCIAMLERGIAARREWVKALRREQKRREKNPQLRVARRARSTKASAAVASRFSGLDLEDLEP